MLRLLGFIDKSIEKLSGGILIVSILSILFLSIIVIVLRWMDTAFLWLEPLLRHLVFLSAFMGGVLATGRKGHIGIDIVGKYFESQKNWKAHRIVGRVVSLTSFLTLLWLTWAVLSFVRLEAQYGKEVFLGIHSQFLVALIPLGTILIAYRFFYLFISSFSQAQEGEG